VARILFERVSFFLINSLVKIKLAGLHLSTRFKSLYIDSIPIYQYLDFIPSSKSMLWKKAPLFTGMYLGIETWFQYLPKPYFSFCNDGKTGGSPASLNVKIKQKFSATSFPKRSRTL